MKTCRPYDELLAAAADGVLRPEEEARLQAHLARCHDCRQALDESRKIVGELRTLPQEELPPFFRTRLMAGLEDRKAAAERSHRLRPWGSLRLAWGTAAVLALVLAVTLVRHTQSRNGPARSPAPTFSQAEVSGDASADEARMAALRAAIQPVSPLDDSVVSGRDVAVCAAFAPSLPPGSLRLLIDGRDVTSVADITSEYVIYAPNDPLGAGPHLVTIEFWTATERVERSWIFYALNGDGGHTTPVSPAGDRKEAPL